MLALVLPSCSSSREVLVRRPIPGGGGFWVERVVVPKERGPGKKKRAPEPDQGHWNGDHLTGPPRIKIHLREQKMYFYKGDALAGVSPISSGREGMETRPGRFAVSQKNADHKSSLFGDYVDKAGNVVKRDVDVRKDRRPPGAVFDAAAMPFFMRFDGAVGMHAGHLPGFPASHGCIRLPRRMAEVFFKQSPLGTPVEVVP